MKKTRRFLLPELRGEVKHISHHFHFHIQQILNISWGKRARVTSSEEWVFARDGLLSARKHRVLEVWMVCWIYKYNVKFELHHRLNGFEGNWICNQQKKSNELVPASLAKIHRNFSARSASLFCLSLIAIIIAVLSLWKAASAELLGLRKWEMTKRAWKWWKSFKHSVTI